MSNSWPAIVRSKPLKVTLRATAWPSESWSSFSSVLMRGYPPWSAQRLKKSPWIVFTPPRMTADMRRG